MSKEPVDNSKVVLQRLMRLYSDEELSDIRLIVGQREFATHKFVLCMSSDVFKTMLTSRTWPEAHSKRIVLQEDPQCAAIFDRFLSYLYNGHVDLEVSNVLLLLTLADKYNIADLSASCLQYMLSHCNPEAEEYLTSWQQYAILCGYAELEEICHTYISNNFESVMHTRQFKNFSKEILLSYLDCSDLVIKSEFNLYLAVKDWVMCNQGRDTVEHDLFKEVMSHIRFPMIPLAQLAYLENDPSVSRYKQFYLAQIFLAIKYHTCYMHRQAIETTKNKNLFTPRNYLGETWSTTLEVDKLSGILPGEVQGAFFTTPLSCCEIDKHNMWDWLVDLYPKGVKFDPCVMIGVPKNLHVDGTFEKNIRLSVAPSPNSYNHNCLYNQRFEISLVIKSSKDGEQEHVCKVLSKRPLFDETHPLFHFNHIVPYKDLNALNSPYTVGKDKLKIVVIIKPLT